MRFRIVPAFLVILILAPLATSSCRADDLALTGATIYRSPFDPPIQHGSILIHQGHILAIGPADAVKISHGTTAIDCKGLVITAGFWNSHVHIFTPGLLHVRDKPAAEVEQQLDTMFNRWGFTTVFDVASMLDNTLALRSRVENGELRGPHILTVGEPIWTTQPIYVRDFIRDQNIRIANTSADEVIAPFPSSP